jgi:hypothetical protein
MPDFSVIPYTPEWSERWDSFVMECSQSGTFLQTRRFLEYHPADRFTDASLMVAMENKELLAVVPAARCKAEGKPLFRSHPGSTFGGLVLANRITQAERTLQILDALDAYMTERYASCELKITPQLFAKAPTALLEYVLFNRGYAQETEIASCLPLSGKALEDLRAGYSSTKRYELRRCQNNGLTMKQLTDEAGLAAFYDVLVLNLKKFDTRPVHTLEELRDFLIDRLKNEIRFLGVFDAAGAMVGGACLFHFTQTNTLHTQYLAVDTRVRGYAPSAFLYDAVIRTGLEMSANAISFGTSTFEHGHVLNPGLMKNKEGYGCLHTLNRIFTKRFAEA